MAATNGDSATAPIYLDYNATTPLDPSVLEAITNALRDAWGNPSSSYAEGVKAKEIVQRSRKAVADMIDAAAHEIIFTSGGTEANHLVFHSVHVDWKLADGAVGLPHVISCPIEHDAVILPLKRMERDGEIELTLLPIDPTTGAVRPDDVKATLRHNTRLVSLMLANNETGAIQPVAAVSEALSAWNAGRSRPRRVLLHTDAAQAIGKVPVSATQLGADYLTVVGHKFYGPRVGALYARGGGSSASAAPLHPLFLGGGQERGFRPGTENTGMIAGLGQAALLVSHHLDECAAHMARVRALLEGGLEAVLGDAVRVNSRFPAGRSLPNTLSVSFLRVACSGSQLLSRCRRVVASVGAACHSERSSRPSPVLLASGLAEAEARCALRLTVGRDTSEADARAAVADIVAAVALCPSVPA